MFWAIQAETQTHSPTITYLHACLPWLQKVSPTEINVKVSNRIIPSFCFYLFINKGHSMWRNVTASNFSHRLARSSFLDFLSPQKDFQKFKQTKDWLGFWFLSLQYVSAVHKNQFSNHLKSSSSSVEILNRGSKFDQDVTFLFCLSLLLCLYFSCFYLSVYSLSLSLSLCLSSISF